MGNRRVGRMLQRVTYTPGHQARPRAERQVGGRQEGAEQRLLGEPRVRELRAADRGRRGAVGQFGDKPIAKQHLEWYLSTGKGKPTSSRTRTSRRCSSRDRGVQAMIEARLPSPWPTSGKSAFDFRSSRPLRRPRPALRVRRHRPARRRGRLDRQDDDRLVPGPLRVAPGLRRALHEYPTTTRAGRTASTRRSSSCSPAGAADYWMKGEATVPLSVLSAGATAAKKSSGWW